MMRQPSLLGLLAGLAVGGPAATAAASVEVRRELAADFAVDEAFQADGGIQLFFELVNAPARPDPGSTLERFRALDPGERLTSSSEPMHAALTRVSYVVEKDLAFFTRERLLDLSYIQAIAPDLDVASTSDGGFEVRRTPSNRFSLAFYPDLSSVAPELVSLARARGAPVLHQRNVDFARVMGWRTAAWSTTWTFHERLGPQRTRVTVLSLSSLYNVPPFFLGGAERVYAETVSQSVALISRLRQYSDPGRR